MSPPPRDPFLPRSALPTTTTTTTTAAPHPAKPRPSPPRPAPPRRAPRLRHLPLAPVVCAAARPAGASASSQDGGELRGSGHGPGARADLAGDRKHRHRLRRAHPPVRFSHARAFGAALTRDSLGAGRGVHCRVRARRPDRWCARGRALVGCGTRRTRAPVTAQPVGVAARVSLTLGAAPA